jgi:selenide, water dikinase
MDLNKFRLTQMVSSAGCAAKFSPNLLSETLENINWMKNENVLVGFEGKDDAGIYKLNDDLALIQTTDFFTPVVDDPYVFGQIAAANSMSDVYAMGGIPISALNILAFPQNEDLTIVKDIIKGGHDKAKEAGCVIIGGHTVDIPTILYGLAVTGTINPKNIKGNNNAKPGDKLILTKQLGTGILNNAIKYSNLNNNIYLLLINSMTRLNKTAAELMVKYGANSCTDITGFGLAGHSFQLALASKIVLRIFTKKIPVLEGAIEAIRNNLLTRCDKSNREYTKDYVKYSDEVISEIDHICYDPQTSGGLLISIEQNKSDKLLDDIRKSGDEYAEIIGHVESPDSENIEGTIIFDYNQPIK